MTEAADGWRRTWAVLCARVVLGLIFGMAGFDKVFNLTPAGHAERYFTGPYADSWIPYWLLWSAGVAVPFIELIGGWLLVAGWRVREAMVGLGLVLMLVTYGHLLANSLYDFSGHVIPRLALLVFVSWVPREVDRLSLDGWLARR
ncbi:MAG: DoxX family membrane protein [Acidobacteria bacterium]|nr:DoxX family membrane protein [Acidobacteriota bacterium]